MKSYVAVQASVAKAMAEKSLTWIENTRKEQAREFLEERLAEVNSGFFRRVFKKPLTLAQLEEKERARDWIDGNALMDIECRFSATEALAERVLVAVRYGDPVNLTLEDLERLA